MNQEQQLQAIQQRSLRWRGGDTGHVDTSAQTARAMPYAVADVTALLRMVEERDAIIHDLQLDGSALARRAVEEFAAGLWDWVNAERQRHQMTNDFDTGAACALGVVQARIDELRASGTAPDPLPPDQVRQECERLRQQIDELLSGCGSHSCMAQRPHGQGVNGPCRCVEKLRAARGEEYTP